jgi:NADPH-dependent ferric siderophore reductase
VTDGEPDDVPDDASDDVKARLLAVRTPPPAFEQVTVVSRDELSPRMLRLTFEGESLRDVEVTQPGTSIRFVVPWPGSELELPEWQGNEFLLSDGSRPALRTFTPLRPDRERGRVDLEIVRHPGGAVSQWAEQAGVGAAAGVSGPGAGYDFPDEAETLIVFGDETAMPAITQLIEMAPAGLRLDIHVETVFEAARLDLGSRDGDWVTWYTSAPGTTPGRRLAEHATALDELPPGTFVWAAGEASAMQAIRNHVFKTLGAARERATVRGYWKPARA